MEPAEEDFADAEAEDVLASLRGATNAMDEAEVTAGSRILFITPTLKGVLDDFSLANPARSNRVLERFSRVVEVPQARFYSAIELLSGDDDRFGYARAEGEYVKTTDSSVVSGKTYYTESGGSYSKVASPSAGSLSTYYELTGAGAPINYMVVERSAVIKFDKHVASRVFSPDELENLDSYMMKYRKYGIVELLDNKLDGVHVSCRRGAFRRGVRGGAAGGGSVRGRAHGGARGPRGVGRRSGRSLAARRVRGRGRLRRVRRGARGRLLRRVLLGDELPRRGHDGRRGGARGSARGAQPHGHGLLGGAVMRYLRPIPRRLLPDDMMVWPAVGDGSFGEVVLVRHVRFERTESAVADAHRSADGGAGLVVVDAVNSEGAFEIPAGSRVLVGAGPSVLVRSCRRCCVIRGVVHHWELEVG